MYVISCILFFPTLGWNLLLNRLCPSRHWWDWVDDSVLLGALPLRRHVPELQAAGISAVINTCREWRGPVEAYRAAGIEELRLPITDFTPPSLEEVRAGVAFIQRHLSAGHKVYVHCKAGRGRSATIVLCYLIAGGLSPEEGQALLRGKRRHVNRHLDRRTVVQQFARLTHHRDTEAQRTADDER